MANLIKLGQGTAAGYASLESKDQYQVYFTTDTHQIFVGADEYTKSTKTLNAVPTEATEGDIGRLYFYNNSLYLCEAKSGNTYTWTRVANVNDFAGVTSVAAEDGVETADGQAITSTGTIKHSIPSGASTVTDALSDQTATFGGTVNIVGVSTDKFGHTTAVNTHTITMPTETPITVTGTTAAQTLSYGDTFEVITGVTKGSGDYDVEKVTTTFALPASDDTTYSISSTTEGVVTLTDSNANATTALINGWNDLAKKSDITSVFKFKGTVASESNLPTTAEVGDVYYVTDTDSEYVCIDDSNPAVWEQLGPIVDLSAYATTADLENALTWRTF